MLELIRQRPFDVLCIRKSHVEIICFYIAYPGYTHTH